MLVPHATSWKGDTEEQGRNGSRAAGGRRREGWTTEGGEEMDRHWEEDTGSREGQRGKSQAPWVFLYFQSSSLFTSILVVELCPY